MSDSWSEVGDTRGGGVGERDGTSFHLDPVSRQVAGFQPPRGGGSLRSRDHVPSRWRSTVATSRQLVERGTSDRAGQQVYADAVCRVPLYSIAPRTRSREVPTHVVH